MTSPVDKITLNLHQGSTLLHLANLHKDGFSAIIELVQNLLDANAKNARIIIDAKQSRIVSLDDGDGADLSEMKDKFSQIGNSLKKKDPNLFGKKGIGSLSAFVIAKLWEFTTRSKSNKNDVYRQYTLSVDEFIKPSGIELDVKTINANEIGSKTLGCKATTQVVLYDVEKSIINQLISGRSDLLVSIQTSFNEKLKQLGINLVIDCRHLDGHTDRLEVKPREFRGTEQEPISVSTEYGDIIFRLYLNPKPLRDPVIRIGYKDPEDGKRYGFPVSLITTGRTKTSVEVKHFLEKGYFEGTIEVGFGSMTPDRLNFIDNIQYKVFVNAVDRVVRETLRGTIEKIESEHRDDKLREIGDNILGKFREYLKKHPSLSEQVGSKMSSLLGLDGIGLGDPASWVQIPKPKNQKKDKNPRKSILREVHEGKNQKEASSGSRKVLPNNGVGIVFVYPDDEESFNWQYRISRGLLEFNCAEDGFVRCSTFHILEEYCMTMMISAIAEIVAPSNIQSRHSKFLEMWVDFKLQNK